jgi:hypothetical protein
MLYDPYGNKRHHEGYAHDHHRSHADGHSVGNVSGEFPEMGEDYADHQLYPEGLETVYGSMTSETMEKIQVRLHIRHTKHQEVLHIFHTKKQ